MPETHYELIYFSGHVQGVGFRYNTLQSSKEFDVVGFVKNTPDGRVQIEVEGTKSEVDAFVQAVHDRMYGHIRKVERNPQRREAIFSGFTIK